MGEATALFFPCSSPFLLLLPFFPFLSWSTCLYRELLRVVFVVRSYCREGTISTTALWDAGRKGYPCAAVAIPGNLKDPQRQWFEPRRLEKFPGSWEPHRGALKALITVAETFVLARPWQFRSGQQFVRATRLADPPRLQITGSPGCLVLWYTRPFTQLINEQIIQETTLGCFCHQRHLWAITLYRAGEGNPQDQSVSGSAAQTRPIFSRSLVPRVTTVYGQPPFSMPKSVGDDLADNTYYIPVVLSAT
ncbi:uncharacterized protein THITE_114193 [Thermothielavioides terrestris NRRL 8126]|uniref:Uncharacterized protein n=1 Tax=Thermothielavioides terrestris (strain ATCC 38088 / NRRL 8126) TaxID=578455 RepID=G2R9L8_THETT|nr:uncharacterized protein THITE_114193 [Thermothielavioides terrestris NRRL 8126]AEO69562.1 hypothetical protein THITE_114193 [Thermothielavioides terrestris NRRL 8126]